MAAFMAVAIVAWGVYAVNRVRRDRGVLAEWGVVLRGGGRTLRIAAVAFVVTAVGIGVLGARLGRLALTPGLALLLLIYPVWAFVEQFLLQAMLARNLAARARAPWVTLACAIVFGIDHLPQVELAGATFALALFVTPLYLKERRLLPIAWLHG